MATNPFAAPRSEAQMAQVKNEVAALHKATSLEPETGDEASVYWLVCTERPIEGSPGGCTGPSNQEVSAEPA
jgi:hypothetical protein